MLVSEWMCQVSFIHWLRTANPEGSKRWSDLPKTIDLFFSHMNNKIELFIFGPKVYDLSSTLH